MFWLVRTSRMEHTGNIVIEPDAKLYSPLKEDGLRTLNAALSSPASSTVEGKVVHVLFIKHCNCITNSKFFTAFKILVSCKP